MSTAAATAAKHNANLFGKISQQMDMTNSMTATRDITTCQAHITKQPACQITKKNAVMAWSLMLGTCISLIAKDAVAVTIETPVTSSSNVTLIKTVVIPRTSGMTSTKNQLDVSRFDRFLEKMHGHARHYPPNFPTPTLRHNSTQKILALSKWIEPYAADKHASFEVLLRAAKINMMARNLDQGEAYASRAGKYIARAYKIKPKDAEMLFIYGAMLAEGGAFRQGINYLKQAAEQGYHEAHQSIAQAYLLTERRSEALEKLKYFKLLVPTDPRIDHQINVVQKGEFYIWK